MVELIKSSREEFESELQRIFVKEFTDGKGHLTIESTVIMIAFGIALFKWFIHHGKT